MHNLMGVRFPRLPWIVTCQRCYEEPEYIPIPPEDLGFSGISTPPKTLIKILSRFCCNHIKIDLSQFT